MNSIQDLSWSQAEQLDAQMVDMQGVDFSNFLDIGDIDLTNFPSLDQDASVNLQHAQQPPNTSFPGEMQGIEGIHGGHASHDFAAETYKMPVDLSQEHVLQRSNGSSTSDLRGFVGSGLANNMAWNGQQQTQQLQEHFGQRHHVPPTPNSYEMHGGDPGRYFQQQMDPQTRAFLEQRYQLHKDQFTPLVSPAATPQDSHFHNAPEYTVPGAYFSPLTSPALQAQNARHQFHHTNPSTAGSSAATSPVNPNFDVDMLFGDGLSLPEPARRSKRKLQTPRSAGPVARVRQSPIQKPQKRKSTTLSNIMQPKDILPEGARSQPGSAVLTQGAFFTDSSAESISPEPLSESLMGPPPRPGSNYQSPVILAQSQSAPLPARTNSGAPATPASLMTFDKSQRPISTPSDLQIRQAMQSTHSDHAGLDDFALPPSATPLTSPSVPPMTSADVTPRIAAQKTPKLGCLSSSARLPQSAASSPMISALNSPAGASTPGDFGKGKGSKKRASVSTGSSMVSPAIRPKISPSIKPMLPGGHQANTTESQHALLLASKSNYTQLLEGTLLPGVQYPESLSSGLTSKRTSHKIAEQGRRNRINEALKEMQSLLPPPSKTPSMNGSHQNGGNNSNSSGKDDDEGGKDDSPKTAAATKAANDAKTANSKAATVESAIEYIKILQQEKAQMENALRGKDEEMSLLRKRLRAADLDAPGDEDVDVDVDVGMGDNGQESTNEEGCKEKDVSSTLSSSAESNSSQQKNNDDDDDDDDS